MINAFRLARCPHSTIRDFIAITELKIVDARKHVLVTRDHTGSVQQLEQACRKLSVTLSTHNGCHTEGKLVTPTEA